MAMHSKGSKKKRAAGQDNAAELAASVDPEQAATAALLLFINSVPEALSRLLASVPTAKMANQQATAAAVICSMVVSALGALEPLMLPKRLLVSLAMHCQQKQAI